MTLCVPTRCRGYFRVHKSSLSTWLTLQLGHEPWEFAVAQQIQAWYKYRVKVIKTDQMLVLLNINIQLSLIFKGDQQNEVISIQDPHTEGSQATDNYPGECIISITLGGQESQGLFTSVSR